MENQHYIFKDLFNVRDLGGYNTSYNQKTLMKKYIRGTARGTLTNDEKELLYNLGVKRVIDLREDYELIEYPHPLKRYQDIEYINIPMTGSFTSMERREIKSLSKLYLDLLDNAKDAFKKVFDYLSNHTLGITYLSCSAGKDRTGVLVYLLFKIAGVSDNDIIANYSESYENNKPRAKDFVLPENYLYFMSSNETEMKEFISDVNKTYGNALGYLKLIGVSNDQIKTIRKNLINIKE